LLACLHFVLFARELTESVRAPRERPHGDMQVSCAVWDSVKERLLVSLSGDHELAGQALLFGTTRAPMLTAICYGPLHLLRLLACPGSGGTRSGGERERAIALQTSERGGTLVASYCGEGNRVTVVPVAVADAAIAGVPAAAAGGGSVGPGASWHTGRDGSQMSSGIRVQLVA
jgi:hypothetical protein